MSSHNKEASEKHGSKNRKGATADRTEVRSTQTKAAISNTIILVALKNSTDIYNKS
jgi:hypothetical protein